MNSGYPTTGRLGFGASIRAGLQLLPTCWRVLVADPAVLLVPTITLLLGLVVIFGYAHLLGSMHNVAAGGKIGLIKALPMVVAVCALGTVGQAVIVADATERLAGRQPRLHDAWLIALPKLPRLLGFGALVAGERTMTAMIRSQRGMGRRLVADVVDWAWDFATFLAIPVILYENLGVFASVRRSGELVARRWGTQLTAQAVLSIAIFVCALPLLVLAALVLMYSLIAGIVLVGIVLLAVMVVGSALTGVLSAAMYRYATTGQVSPGFTQADMWSVFSRRAGYGAMGLFQPPATPPGQSPPPGAWPSPAN
jgi:hypothetical protein